jgi:chromodomain-helicase-DNA-binding protein 4
MVQDGKKKLALDHVIVQRMDDDVSKDLQSIFTFGAKALFEETDTSTDIVCE